MAKDITPDDVDAMADRLFEIGKEHRLRGEYDKAADMVRTGMRMVRNDITQRRENSQLKRDNAQLQEDSITDPMTGIPHRGAFMPELVRAVAAAERASTEFEKTGVPIRQFEAVVFIDVDGMKPVNDGMGHAAGDSLIKAVATRLSETVRKDEICARIGGDEFAVLISDGATDEWFMEKAEDRLKHAFDGLTFEHEGLLYPVSISVGAAVIDGTVGPEDVLKLSDMALYEAKKSKGNTRDAPPPDPVGVAPSAMEHVEEIVLESEPGAGLPEPE